MRKLTQEVFKDAPPGVKSAVMDLRGMVWLFECPKKHLTPNHRSWVSDIETAFYFHSGLYDATDWQNSAIDRDGLTIDLTDSVDFYNMCNDSASVELLGDNTQLLNINVGHDGLKIRAHFITLHDVMNAIAEANGFKVIPVISDEHAKDAINHSEYFDAAGKYHVNKPAAKTKAKPVSRKTYIKQAGMLDFKESKESAK